MEKNTTTIIVLVIIVAVAIFAFSQKGCSISGLMNNATYSTDNGFNNPSLNQTPDTNNPRCIDHDGNDIWLASHVDDTVLKVSYPDTCKDEPFHRYLYEKVCLDGMPSQVEIDCWAEEGTICDSGACVKQSCANILNPNSQTDCDKGHASCSDAPNTYCKYSAPTVQAPSKCVCTIDPETVDTCDESCIYFNQVDGFCADPMQQNPCGSYTHYMNYDSLCPVYTGGLHRACCCRI